jgi:zinc protease
VGPLHPDAAPLDVAALVLSAGRGSWLYRLLRQPGTVTSIGAYHYSPTELGVFAVSADLETTAIEAALAGIGSAVAHLADTGPEALDLERAKTLFRARWARRFETADGRAATFAHAEALGGLAILDREYREALAVTAEDVVRVARAYLRPDSASGVAFLPNDRGAPLEAADVAQILSRPPRFPLQAVPAPALVVPPPAVIRGAHTAGVTHWAAPHADLLVRPKSGVPLVTLGLYRRRATTETMEEAGLGTLAMRSLARGAGGYDAEQLAAIFETMGGTLSTSVNADWFGVGTTVLADHAQEAALMLRAVLESPHYRDDDVERERRILHDEVRQVTDDMFRYPVQLAFSQAFHWKGYGVPVLGWPDTVERLSSEAVRRWHQRELTGGRTVAVVAGDVVPDEMLGALASILERPIASGFTAAPAAAAGTVALPDGVVTRLKNQSAVAMVFPGPSRRAQDRHAAMVWAGVASGLGGRLFTVLRDQRSLAYTVMATSWQRRDAGALVTYIATSPEREEEARASMLEELARFAREPVAADELERAVNYLAGQTEVQRQSMGSLAAEIVDAWLVGTGLEELEDPIAPFRAVTREDVHQVANRYLDPGARTEGVVRGTVGGR